MRIPFANEGIPIMLLPLGVAAILFITGKIEAGSVFLLMALFVISFFRDPERTAHPDPHSVVAAADGEILAIKEINEDLFIKEPSVQIITFLSVFNVHINRAPIEGKIAWQQYTPGTHFDSFNPKADTNEKNFIGIENSKGIRIMVTQITGSLARRVVSKVSVGQKIKKGDRLGLIKFGSRTDVVIPRSKLEKILVKVGDKTKGAETPLAILKE